MNEDRVIGNAKNVGGQVEEGAPPQVGMMYILHTFDLSAPCGGSVGSGWLP